MTRAEAPGIPYQNRSLTIKLITIASFLFACGKTYGDPDLWGHTLYGMRALEQGLLAEPVDPFSFTVKGLPWVNHEWLAERIMGFVWSSAGSFGLWMMRNLLVGIVFWAAWCSIRHQQGTPAAAFLLLVPGAMCLTEFVVFIRPQLFTFACFALTILIARIHWTAPESKSIWSLPVLLCFWTNCHGGFLAGIGILSLFVIAWWLRHVTFNPCLRIATQFTLVFFLSLLATLINPYGIGLYQMLWEHLVPHQDVREWQALTDQWQESTYYIPFLVMGLCLGLSNRWAWIDLIILSVVSLQAINHIRHVALLCISTMLLLPAPAVEAVHSMFPNLYERWKGPEKRTPRIVLTSIGIMFLVAFQIFAMRIYWLNGISFWEIACEVKSDTPGVPLRAIAVLKSLSIREGKLITSYGWAQYAIWHLYPEIEIAFDGRYRTVYPPQVEQEFLAFVSSEPVSGKSFAIIDKYGTNIALFPVESRAAKTLGTLDGWVKIYEDDQAVIYLKNTKPLTIPAVPINNDWFPFPAGIAELREDQ